MNSFPTDFSGQKASFPDRESPLCNICDLVILGPAPLMGAMIGYLAIEPLGSGAKLWTLYDDEDQKRMRPYARVCIDPPKGSTSPKDVPKASPLHPCDEPQECSFWINPANKLAAAACLGSEWLIPASDESTEGLIRADINALMLSVETISSLRQHRLFLNASH